MNLEFDQSDRSLTFQEWLKKRYNTTPPDLFDLAKATGRYGDYDKLLEWYRRRYRQQQAIPPTA